MLVEGLRGRDGEDLVDPLGLLDRRPAEHDGERDDDDLDELEHVAVDELRVVEGIARGRPGAPADADRRAKSAEISTRLGSSVGEVWAVACEKNEAKWSA